jgi:hypothetical protein
MSRSFTSSSDEVADLIAARRTLVNARPRAVSNRRFVGTACCAFLAFFALDWFLFANEGFLRHFGQATQEGQVVSKVTRAARQAEIADVIFFGSSFVRSGMAGEPFLQRGLLPFNFAVSGGGPVYDYFALKRIAPILTRRDAKPVLVLELNADVLRRLTNSAWSEYPQYISIVRSRFEMLEHARLLWWNFRDFNLTSQFLGSVLIPSSIYRSHAVSLLGQRATLDGYFYGMEDFSGYSPLYTRAVPAMSAPGPPVPAIPLSAYWPGKLEFLRAFLSLATSTGCQVALYESPTILLGRDSAQLDGIVAQLQREFPALRTVRMTDYHLRVEDFDEGGHLNIGGADKMSDAIVNTLGLTGDQARLVKRIDVGFQSAALQDLTQWTRAPDRVAVEDGAFYIRPTRAATPLVVESRPIRVSPGREWVLELAVPESRGRLFFKMSWTDPTTGAAQAVAMATPVEAPLLGRSARFFIRATPTSDRVTIRIEDYDLAIGQAPAEAVVKILRLWTNR